VTVIDLAARRTLPCPHCDATPRTADLDRHLRYERPVLESKRRHPSQRQTPDGAA
jgi:glutaredoxin